MKILLVDDKSDSLYLLESILKGSAYQVISARNGKQALERVAVEKPDLIISDILMPIMDGFQLCRQVKQNDDWSRIPFVFYTATYTDKKDEELALKEGADRFLRKPMEPEEFIAAIQAVIQETEEKKIVGKKPQPGGEEETLELYNARLVQKLEKKMFDLEKETEERRKIEEALRLSEARYRMLFNAGSDAMFVHDLPGRGKRARFIEVNNVACERLEYSREEFLKLTPEDLLMPESIKSARQALNKLKTQKTIIFEAVRVTKTGKEIPVEINSTLFDLNGKNTVLSISRDITERKQAQKALQES